MTKLDSILKSRDFTLPAKICIVKAMVFLVVMYGCESGTINKSTEELITFELWCWRRLLRVAWTAMKSTLNIADAEVEAPILWPYDEKKKERKKKLSHLKRPYLILGKIEGRRRG